MNDRSYVGIDSTDNHEWIVALWDDGEMTFSPPFKNTPTGLGALVCYILERCVRPKICLRPSNPAAIKLIKYLGSIPDVEVVMMFEAGLRLQQAWLSKAISISFFKNNTCQAQLLACCAERMI